LSDPNRLIPGVTAEEIRHVVTRELSTVARLAHVALLVGASLVVVLVGSLWMTEPDLPVRTRIAFASIVAIGLAWVGFASWVLTRRRVLYGHDRVLAGWMAVLFCAMFSVGAVAIAASGLGGGAGYLAAAMGAALLAVAIAVLRMAQRKQAELVARRGELERRLGILHAPHRER